MGQDLDQGQLDIIRRVQKILNLAANNPNEAEAAAAQERASAMLRDYNLTMAQIEENGDGSGGRRAEENLEGGREEWQRDLWEAVAELNFCAYFNQKTFVESKLYRTFEYRVKNGVTRKVFGAWQFRHNVVGRVVNIAATKAMAEHLEMACDRITKDHCKNTNEKPTGRYANNFRDGISWRVITKIMDKQKDFLADEKRKQMEAIQKAAESGVVTGNAVALSTYIEAEQAANFDFKNGDGAWAKRLAKRAEWAQQEREEEARYTKWAADHPKEAAAQERERNRESAKDRRRDQAWVRRQVNKPGYLQGFRAGEEVSLDQQAEHQKVKGLLT